MKKTTHLNFRLAVISFLISFCLFSRGYAEPVRNGNEMALSYATNNMTGKITFAKSVTGKLHTFRYLKVTEIKSDTPREGAATLMAVEPSSALAIKMIVSAPLSLAKALNLQTGECIAVRGRVKSLGTEEKDLLVIAPAIISHKDRAGPKLSKELLREIDPDAH